LAEAAAPAAIVGENVYSVILPVVIVADASLWVVSYDEKTGTASTPGQVDQCEFFVGYRTAVNWTNP
jgi:hypothetical protein